MLQELNENNNFDFKVRGKRNRNFPRIYYLFEKSGLEKSENKMQLNISN